MDENVLNVYSQTRTQHASFLVAVLQFPCSFQLLCRKMKQKVPLFFLLFFLWPHCTGNQYVLSSSISVLRLLPGSQENFFAQKKVKKQKQKRRSTLYVARSVLGLLPGNQEKFSLKRLAGKHRSFHCDDHCNPLGLLKLPPVLRISEIDMRVCLTTD